LPKSRSPQDPERLRVTPCPKPGLPWP
jgi:hypothetical protein